MYKRQHYKYPSSLPPIDENDPSFAAMLNVQCDLYDLSGGDYTVPTKTIDQVTDNSGAKRKLTLQDIINSSKFDLNGYPSEGLRICDLPELDSTCLLYTSRCV